MVPSMVPHSAAHVCTSGVSYVWRERVPEGRDVQREHTDADLCAVTRCHAGLFVLGCRDRYAPFGQVKFGIEVAIGTYMVNCVGLYCIVVLHPRIALGSVQTSFPISSALYP